MAVIINDPKQVQTLEEIQTILTELHALGAFLSGSNLTLVTGAGRARTELNLPEIEQNRIRRLLAARQERLSKEVLLKAGKYQIRLEDSDLAVLSPSTASQPSGE